MGYLLKLLSTFCFGIENCLWKFPLNGNIPFLNSIFIRSLISSVLLLLLNLLVFFIFSTQINNKLINVNFKSIHLVLSIMLSAFSYYGLHFYNLSLKHGTVSTSVSIASLKTWLGVGIGLIVFKENFSIIHLFSFVMILIGVFLIDNKKGLEINPSKNTLFALLAAFFWGISFALFKYTTKWMGPLLFSLILETTVCMMSMIISVYYFKTKIKLLPLLKVNPIFFLMGALVVIAVIFNNLSYNYLPVSTISLLSNNTQIVALLFSAFVLNERLSLKKYFGIVVVLIAIILISL
ncbi:MAG: DMT family transporter [Bacteroidetes bacterium]|nr:DMT family transporter [Bacteroidota bacterium]